MRVELLGRATPSLESHPPVGPVLHLVELTTLKRIYPFASHMLEHEVRWAVGLPSPGVAPTSAR
jgi:hypothetical protein